MIEKSKYPYEITKMRSDLAVELVGIRKQRDAKRKESKTIKSKLFKFSGASGGSKKLALEADKLQRDTRKKLSHRKAIIADREEEIKFSHRLEEILETIESLDKFRYAKELDESGATAYLNKIVANKSVFEQSLNSEDRTHNYAYESAKALNKLADLGGINVYLYPDLKNQYFNASTFALAVITEQLPAIESQINEDSLFAKQEFISLINKLIIYGDGKSNGAAVATLTKHLDTLQNLLEADEYNYDWVALDSLDLIFGHGNDEQREKAKKTATSLLDRSYNQKNNAYSLIGRLCDSRYPASIKAGEALLKMVLDKYSLDSEKALRAWFQDGRSAKDSICANLTTIKELESKKPGVTNFLREKFGILDFRRYPHDVLISQSEEFENIDVPYGVVIFPRSDWNGSFSGDVHLFKSLHQQLQGKYALRVFECETKQDIARMLIKLHKKYNAEKNENKKISFAIIGGHGTPNNIQFGSGEERYALNIDDLLAKGAQRTSEYLKKDATIILLSCSTGANEGIGQRLSEKLGLKVIAPAEPTNIKQITATIEENRINFSVSYTNGERNMFKNGKKMIDA